MKKSLCLEFLNQGLAVSQSLEFTILYPYFFVKKNVWNNTGEAYWSGKKLCFLIHN